MSENNLKKMVDTANCPIRNVLNRFGDKWSILILLILDDQGVSRFNQIGKHIGDISQKMLTTTLRTLEADGLVSRKMYAEIPPRVEYALTERGKTLVPLIRQLVDWSVNNMQAIQASRSRVEAGTLG